MRLLGVDRPVDLAKAVGLTKQAINSWSDPLTVRQANRVHAELWRRSQEAKPSKRKPAAAAA